MTSSASSHETSRDDRPRHGADRPRMRVSDMCERLRGSTYRRRERAATMLAMLIAAAGVGCQNGAALSPSTIDGSANGRETGDGSTDELSTFTVAELIGAVGPCAVGYAHPNVCCHRGACTERPHAPFAACDLDSLTFPDRGLCCSLDHAGDCVAASAPDAGADAGPPRCALPCSPAGKTAASANFGECSNQENLSCVYCCEGLSCPSNGCNCPEGPPCPADAPAGSCPTQPPCTCDTPTCAACPASWTDAAPQVDLCCRGSASGSPECFSQAASVNAPAESGGMFSGPNGCEIYNSMGGHTYDLACDVTMTPQCTCSLDGAPTMSFPFAKVSCSLTVCGFPPWPP
jgi:hypothetical protein